jgi:hypothetical protein
MQAYEKEKAVRDAKSDSWTTIGIEAQYIKRLKRCPTT